MTSSMLAVTVRTPSMAPNVVAPIPAVEQIRETYMELGDRAYRQECFDIAEKMYQAALQETSELVPENACLGTILFQLGRFYFQRGLYKKAEVLCKRSLDSFERNNGRYQPSVYENFGLLGHLASVDGKFTHAEKFFKRQWVISKRVYDKHDPRISVPIRSLVQLYRKYGRMERAEALSRRFELDLLKS